MSKTSKPSSTGFLLKIRTATPTPWSAAWALCTSSGITNSGPSITPARAGSLMTVLTPIPTMSTSASTGPVPCNKPPIGTLINLATVLQTQPQHQHVAIPHQPLPQPLYQPQIYQLRHQHHQE